MSIIQANVIDICLSKDKQEIFLLIVSNDRCGVKNDYYTTVKFTYKLGYMSETNDQIKLWERKMHYYYNTKSKRVELVENNIKQFKFESKEFKECIMSFFPHINLFTSDRYFGLFLGGNELIGTMKV